MIINNNTNSDLFINDHELKSGDRFHVMVHIFDTVNIHSNIGSAEIICEYGDRHIKCYGDLELRKSQSDLDGDEYSVEIKVQ